MYLIEEYLDRNELKGVRFVRHVTHGSLFFKTDSDPLWRILWIKWREPSYHPGTYCVRALRPIHNGGPTRNLFENPTRRDKVLHWDEYEDFMIDWSRSVAQDSVPVCKKEVYLAAWETLLYCYDLEVARNGFSGHFFATIDLSLSTDDRYEALMAVISYIASDMPNLHEAWEYEMMPYVRSHSSWLVELVEANGYVAKY